MFSAFVGFLAGGVLVGGFALSDHQRMRRRIEESLEDVVLLRSALSGLTLLNDTLLNHQMPQALGPPATPRVEPVPPTRVKAQILH